jgi:hypothetical protein
VACKPHSISSIFQLTGPEDPSTVLLSVCIYKTIELFLNKKSISPSPQASNDYQLEEYQQIHPGDHMKLTVVDNILHCQYHVKLTKTFEENQVRYSPVHSAYAINGRIQWWSSGVASFRSFRRLRNCKRREGVCSLQTKNVNPFSFVRSKRSTS